MRCLRQLGFRGPYSGGKHQFMVKEHLRVRIPNPHRGDIGQNLLRAILREAGFPWQNGKIYSCWRGSAWLCRPVTHPAPNKRVQPTAYSLRCGFRQRLQSRGIWYKT